MKELIRIITISIVIAAILFVINVLFMYTNGEDVQYDSSLLIMFAYHVMYSFPLTLVNSYFFSYLNHKVKWNKYKEYRFLIGFLGSIVISLITIFFIRVFHKMVIGNYTYEEFINSESLNFYFISLLICIVASLFFHAFYFYQQLQKNKIKEQKVIAGTASAKFDALKNQLDPHFLFNSLNVLTSLIDENPDNAQKFTTALSKVYRYVLEQKNKDLVSVDEELDFAKTYMSLLKMRFEDSLIFEIPERATSPESKVVPLSLQLLLENAVKHNTVTSNKPLHIKIYESEGNLIIENNLQVKQVVKKSSGVGLNNIRQRYNLLSTRQVKINHSADRFAVALPMLTKQISIMQTKTQSRLDDSYVGARKHVEELKEFYYGIISYCLVIPFLIFINWYTSWDFQWFWFPMLGWGMGIAFHAYKVFVNDGVLGRNWEKRKIKQFMQEEENAKNRWN
ncbi:histidine kinase [Flavobacteriaceae bacterium AU392]|nr:histidine kinase [Flavobacteriaceae bacterium]RKM83617.1 histidine kinase [Flavobacteriaceae bacterium AU392]